MLLVPKTIRLASSNGSLPDARVVRLTPQLAADRIDARWMLQVDNPKFKKDWDWVWAEEISCFEGNSAIKCLAIQTADEEIQGAIVYTLGKQSLLSPPAPAV